jgi:hypothetical protein
MTDEHQQESGRGWGFGWFTPTVLVLSVYVLSVGPAGAVVKKKPQFAPIARAFYMPSVWLHERTPLRSPLDAYARLWGWQ